MNQYQTKEYNHKSRWLSYSYQFENILRFNPKKILEIGTGSGITAKVLEDNNVEVITLDNNSETNPDIVGDVLKLPFTDNFFDMAVAFEILEHLPFSSFAPALKEMRRVSKKNIIISVPDHSKTILRLTFKIPFIKEKFIQIRIPAINNKRYWAPAGHLWEMGDFSYPYKKVVKEIEKSGLKIIKSFVPHDSAWTRYFILEK